MVRRVDLWNPAVRMVRGRDFRFKSHPIHLIRGRHDLWLSIGSYIILDDHIRNVATTTIQLSQSLKKTLESMKLHPRETYEEVLERILEDLRELNQQTKEEIEKALKEIKAGKYRSHEQLKAEMGF